MEMESLTISLKYKGETYGSTVFGKDHLFGAKFPYKDNLYHILVLDDFVNQKDLPSYPMKDSALDRKRQEAFWRIHRLAMNYAVQSDTYGKELEKLYGIKAKYEKPRLLMVSEEWLDIPKEVVAKPKKRGGLFGGALDDVAAEIAGEKKIVSTYKPTYSMNVILNEIEASGDHPISFQTARSLWDDILEGKVIYESVKDQGRVLTATVVFSQMEKNKTLYKEKNDLFVLDKDTLVKLNELQSLWPEAKESIRTFLEKNPEWKTVIPRYPVAFYDKKRNFLYAMYAWFNIHPQSGRMIGMLPTDIHGSINEVWEKYEKKAIMKTKEVIEETGAPGTSAVNLYLSTVAGMYVSSGGVLSVVNLALGDPKIANLSDKEWKKFVALHSMNFCQKFLKDQADVYDSYETIAGFWMGACAITNKLGGPGPGGECLKNAYYDIRDKFISDTKKKAAKMLAEGREKGEKAIEERVDRWRDSKVKKITKDMVKTKNMMKDLSEKMGNAKEKVNELDEMAEDVKTIHDEISR